MQTQNPGPVCQNCLASTVLCTAYREYDSRACCGACEHGDAPSVRADKADSGATRA